MSYSETVLNPEDSARHDALLAFANLLDDMLSMVAESPEDSGPLQIVIADARYDARRAAYELTGAYADDQRNQAIWADDSLGDIDLAD